MYKEFNVKVPNKVSVIINDTELTISRKGFMSFGSGLHGEKTIPLANITAVQVKRPGMQHGYIQFSILGAAEAKGTALELMKDENTIVFSGKHYDDMLELKSLIDSSRMTAPDRNNDDLDQLIKLKSLLDEGILTQDEFDAKKKQILNR